MEFLLAVPRRALFDPLRTRAGMQRALSDILPPEILARTTKGGAKVPMERARRRHAEVLAQAVPLTGPVAQWRLVERGIVDPSALTDAVRHTQTGGVPPDFLDRCLHLEAWLRTLGPLPDVSRLSAMGGRTAPSWSDAPSLIAGGP